MYVILSEVVLMLMSLTYSKHIELHGNILKPKFWSGVEIFLHLKQCSHYTFQSLGGLLL